MSKDIVDMSATLRLLEEVTEYVRDLDGVRVDSETIKSREINKAKSDISKRLLYAAHLTDLARAAVLNEYHRFKGERPPEIHA